jgi:hypothetical protein
MIPGANHKHFVLTLQRRRNLPAIEAGDHVTAQHADVVNSVQLKFFKKE